MNKKTLIPISILLMIFLFFFIRKQPELYVLNSDTCVNSSNKDNCIKENGVQVQNSSQCLELLERENYVTFCKALVNHDANMCDNTLFTKHCRLLLYRRIGKKIGCFRFDKSLRKWCIKRSKRDYESISFRYKDRFVSFLYD